MADQNPSPNEPQNQSPQTPGGKQANWGLWILIVVIGSILLLAFNFDGAMGGATKDTKLDEFSKMYREGLIVQNNNKHFPIIVTTEGEDGPGVITAYSYKQAPQFTNTQFYLPFHEGQDINSAFNRIGITNRQTVEGDMPSTGQRLNSTDMLIRLWQNGQLVNSSEQPITVYQKGNEGVVVGYFRNELTTTPNRKEVNPVRVPFSSKFQGQEVQTLLGNHATYKVDNSNWFALFINLLPIAVIILIFFFIMRAQGGGAGGAMKFAKNRARLLDPSQNKVTFKDVAGVAEAKEEVWEIVEFLRNPDKFRRLGATIPKGILMVGSPGTGKTLLARAIAGEAQAPFYTISGSDFVEMFVGVGASRVRDMFAEAKRNSPCLIFIDEIDAVGRHRGHGVGGGHDEREQTLNALLVEMDGFTATENVIVIAATNRVDVLDPALLRPGRFDRQVTVNLPDAAGREQILGVHIRKVKLSPEVNLGPIARATTGFSGAELANLVNEAALIAARKDQEFVMQADLEEAREKVRWGRERRSLEITDKEKRLTAVHEAGHALCLLKTELRKSLPLHKVTVIPRGPALGVTMMLPDEDQHSEYKSELLDYIVMAMGGRVAEEVIFGDISGGASGDIQSATAIARKMVCVYGMSEKLGPVKYGDSQGEVFYARDAGHSGKGYSEKTAEAIDAEIQRIVEENYARAKEILSNHREQLELIADKLIEYETLSGKQIEELLETGSISNPPDIDAPPPMPEENEGVVETTTETPEEESESPRV